VKCTHALHDELKRDRALYEAETEHGYWQTTEDGALEFRHCRRCRSSLHDGTKR
jgi:hypothetical protein